MKNVQGTLHCICGFISQDKSYARLPVVKVFTALLMVVALGGCSGPLTAFLITGQTPPENHAGDVECSSTEPASVEVTSTEARPNEKGTVYIEIHGGPEAGLSNFEADVRYEETLVQATDVNSANGYSISAFRIENDQGFVRLIGFKVGDNLICNGRFVQLTFRAVGQSNSSSRVEVSFRTLNAPDGQAIEHRITNGSFAIR